MLSTQAIFKLQLQHPEDLSARLSSTLMNSQWQYKLVDNQMAARDYILPVSRPKRALECLQQGQPITCDILQCQWVIKPFDECRRL